MLFYATDTSIDARNFSSLVMQNPGPVLLLQPIQANSRTEIYSRVGNQVPVHVGSAADGNALQNAIDGVITAFDEGDPKIPLDLAVALMLMNKLDQNHMWTGNAKGYMWADDLPNGRGFDKQYACRLGQVIRILEREKLLVYKTSKGSRKYALNPERRQEIYEILRTRQFFDAARKGLGANVDVISVRVLDDLVRPEVPKR